MGYVGPAPNESFEENLASSASLRTRRLRTCGLRTTTITIAERTSTTSFFRRRDRPTLEVRTFNPGRRTPCCRGTTRRDSSTGSHATCPLHPVVRCSDSRAWSTRALYPRSRASDPTHRRCFTRLHRTSPEVARFWGTGTRSRPESWIRGWAWSHSRLLWAFDVLDVTARLSYSNTAIRCRLTRPHLGSDRMGCLTRGTDRKPVGRRLLEKARCLCDVATA